MAEKLHSSYQIRWKNFRRFEDTGWIEIKPLTILLGANNAGKSSVISPLLLLSQTLESKDGEVPLVPFGPLIDLGTYKDFIHAHEVDRELFLGMRFHTHPLFKKAKKVGAYPPGGFELLFSAGSTPERVNLKRLEVTDIFNRLYFSRSTIKNGYSLEGAIPLSKMTPEEQKAVTVAQPENFLFSPNEVFFELERNAIERDAEVKSQAFSKDLSHYLRAIGFTHSNVRALFSQLSYVGPLRAKLQRFYRVSPELPDTVGSRGENAANLYRRGSNKLKADVDSWVKRFDFGESLESNDLTDDVFQLQFKSGRQKTNVADAGCGASQVLPLIIQAAAAPHDSLTLAEQPEIHLNPKLQCVLADLFVDMATSGHRVIVETHSEHLIVRLRRLVAEGKIDAADVGLYFVEKNSGISTIREIPIGDNGGIERESWPQGFFDDALREALALASVQSKEKKLGSPNNAARKAVTKKRGSNAAA